ncbi:Peptidyl-prolyl cis-trans isomerase FKBP43 [Linum perenne]
MAFWGAEVALGELLTHHSGGPSLRLTQAILGKIIDGSSGKCSVECTVGCKAPVNLCILILGVCETCPINVDFDECDDVVFSVVGIASVHLIGNLKHIDDAIVAAAVETDMEVEIKDNALEDTKDGVVVVPDGISERQSVELEKELLDEKEKHQKLVEEDDVPVKDTSDKAVKDSENAVKEISVNALRMSTMKKMWWKFLRRRRASVPSMLNNLR